MGPKQRGLPFSGRSPIARHNSYLGAVSAEATRGEKKQRVLAYLKTVRAATDQGIAEGTRLPLSSVCSLRNHLVGEELVRVVGRVIGRYGHPVTLWCHRDRWPEATIAFGANELTEMVDMPPAVDVPAETGSVCGS